MSKLSTAPRHHPDDARRFVEEGYWNDDTLTTFLARWAEQAPGRTAIVDAEGRTYSYAETYECSLRFANGLLESGFRKGDVIGIQLPNHPEYLFAYFGVTMMGGVLLTMHMPYRAGEMAPLLNHGGAKAVICGPASAAYDAPATMLSLAGEVPTLEHVIVGRGAAPPGTRSLARMIAHGAAAPVADPPVASDPALLCFTSGTSARPKGVLRSYETIASNARIFAPEIELSAEDVVMTAPPFTHVFGLCCVNVTLFAGATSVLMPQFTPEAYCETIGRGRPTVIFSAPAHVAASLKAGLLEQTDLSSIRDVIIAGSVCPPEVAAALERLMPQGRAGQLFGMTEVILVMQTPLDAEPALRHHSTGRATRGIEARVVDENDDPLPPGREGELHLRGYSVMAGYLDNDEANRAAFTSDRWFRTGDLAIMTESGDCAITGRVKDIINRGGVKINPTEIESLIAAHPKVVQAAIVPMADEILGERACLFVTLADPARVLKFEEMTAYLAQNRVAKLRWPERLEVVDEMPMTPTRKIIKGELAQRLVE